MFIAYIIKLNLTNNFMTCKICVINFSIMANSYLWLKFKASGLPSNIHNVTMSRFRTTFDRRFLNGFEYRLGTTEIFVAMQQKIIRPSLELVVF